MRANAANCRLRYSRCPELQRCKHLAVIGRQPAPRTKFTFCIIEINVLISIRLTSGFK
jgi:hypothetical protein